MIFKITYYDEIEAETEQKAIEILKAQITTDVEYGDFSCFELEEVIEEESDDLMNEYQKLEWLHSQISELKDGVEVDLETMQSFIEDLREPYLEEMSDEL